MGDAPRKRRRDARRGAGRGRKAERTARHKGGDGIPPVASRANVEFHERLFEMTGNPYLADAIKQFALQAAVQPIEDAFRILWPEVRRTNLLDDSLTADRAAAGAQTPALSKRMVDLARYAAGSGADGILFTCSAFGEGIELAAQQLSIPVLKPNEAMFDAALAIGGRIGMLATFEPAVASMEEEFRTMAQAAGSEATLETVIVPGGRAALMANDLATHDQLIARATAGLDHCDAILLAHFSMATAESAAQSHTRRPVLSAPASAVVKLKAMIGER